MTASPTAALPSRRDFALYAAVPIVVTAVAVIVFWSIGSFAGDFHKEFWPAGLRVLHGQSPYILDRTRIDNGLGFPYPPLTALLFAPFAVLARGVSEVAFTLICFACLAATLRVLEVRDWRVYGVVLLWTPVINAWQSANLTLVLALLLAVAWRYRDRPAMAGAAAAAAVALKPFVWPIVLWLIVTRRVRAALVAIGGSLVATLLAFAVLGFDQISRYLTDGSRVSSAFFRISYTPVALGLDLGAGTAAATAIGALIALAAAGACVWAAVRGDDFLALTLTVALALLATPVLWMHYFALVVVPLAIAYPRLKAAWGLPVVLIFFGSRSSSAGGIVIVLVVMGAVLLAAARRGVPA